MRMRILVIEDDPDTANSLYLLLNIYGYDVEVACNGEVGVVAARNSQPDVILLDIGMPRLNGYEVARQVKEQPSPKRPLLVAVSGYGDEKARQRSEEAGIDLHLVKPVSPDYLQCLLSRFQRVIGETVLPQ